MSQTVESIICANREDGIIRQLITTMKRRVRFISLPPSEVGQLPFRRLLANDLHSAHRQTARAFRRLGPHPMRYVTISSPPSTRITLPVIHWVRSSISAA